MIQQPEPGRADGGDMAAMPGHQVTARRHIHPLPVCRHRWQCVHRQRCDVVEATLVIAVAAHTETDRRRCWPLAVELCPLPGNRTAAVATVPHADAGHLEGRAVDQPGRLGAGLWRVVEADRVHQCQFLQAPLASSAAVFDNHLPNIGRVLVFGDAGAPWGSLLLFGASSAYPMLKYLKRLFRRIVFVHSAGNADAEIVRHERPDYLVLQTTARFMVTPPDTGFRLADAVAAKLQGANDDARLRARASAAKARADARNLPYCQMTEQHED